VQFVLRQGIPSAIAEWVASGDADIGIRGKAEAHDELLFMPIAELDRSVIVPRDHPLLEHKRLALDAVAQFPLVTLDRSLEGGWIVADAFEAAGITPNVVLSALDADVVKSYVEVGLGIAILLSVAYEPDRDRELRAIAASHLFGPTTPHVVLRYGKYLPGYMYDFIERLAPQCNRQAIDAAMRFSAEQAGG
jgi:LysR family transcriptional regulator, cys regulon transcriptional activator